MTVLQERRGRPLASAICLVAGALVLLAGALLTDAARGLFTPRGFADRVAASLRDPRVAAYAAGRVTDAVLAESRDLTPFRPLILALTDAIVGSEPFSALARRGARRLHQTIFSEESQGWLLSVPDVGVLVRGSLAQASPALAEKVPARIEVLIGSVQTGRVARVLAQTWRIGRRLGLLSLVGLLLGPALLLASLLLAEHRRIALFRIGLALVALAAVLLAARPIGSAIVSRIPRDPDLGGAAAGLWNAATQGWRAWAFLFGGAGLVFAAAAHSLLQQIELAETLERAFAWLKQPEGTARAVLRAGGLLAIGSLAVAYPAAAVHWAALLIGAVAAFEGLRELFSLLLRRLPETVPRRRPARDGTERSWPVRGIVVGGVATLLVAVLIVANREETAPVPPGIPACNGAAELCGRRVDQVVFPGTHNSMSTTEVSDWMFPQQEARVGEQLRDGIRALLIDAHYGRPVGDQVKTDLESEPGAAERYLAAVGPEGWAAAMRIRERLVGRAEGDRDVYSCHGFCEFGAVPFASLLGEVHEFLVAHPNEVILLLVEDYVEPADLAGAFEESGLIEFVYRGRAAPPWPTLGEMISADERVIVLAESGRPGVPWIHPAFEVLQETPYSVRDPGGLSCGPGRGGAGASLFLVNHWIDTPPTPRPSNAEVVNAYDFLLARCQRCREERGMLPNIVAVDFYRTGDLFRVCRTLNGLDSTAVAAGSPRPARPAQ